MIKFRLICNDCSNSFDSWFASSKEYEKLKKQKYLNCDFCNSSSIKKTLMSPSILKNKDEEIIKIKNDGYKKIKKTINEYQKFIKKNFKNVGENFAYEARMIHYNDEKKSKGIYGTASKKELKELKEEGIKTDIIPWLKDNNN
mgnify:CR=1 FL=1